MSEMKSSSGALSDEQVRDLWTEHVNFDPAPADWPEVLSFARAIVAAATPPLEPIYQLREHGGAHGDAHWVDVTRTLFEGHARVGNPAMRRIIYESRQPTLEARETALREAIHLIASSYYKMQAECEPTVRALIGAPDAS